MLDGIPSDAKIRSLLRRSTFGPRPHCPRCGSSEVLRSERRFRCPKCRRPFSVTSCSWLRGMKVAPRVLWMLLLCWQRGIAFRTTQDLTGLSHVTVRRWFRRFRENLAHASPTLSGTVEVDEAWLGKRRHGNQTIVIGAVERGTGRAVIRVMGARDQERSDRFLLRHVAPGTTVYTDGWEGYRGIDAFFGYRHSAHIHDHGDFGPTNHAENLWSRLKGFIRRTWHHAWREHLPGLLREFEARINSPGTFASPLAFLETCLYAVPSR